MKTRISEFATRYSIALAWVYFTLLFGWLALYLLSGDRFGYLGLVNNFAVYLFFPLIITAILALITRRKELIGGTLLGTAVFLWFWGALFMPRLSVPKGGNPHPPLTAMTYNVLGSHGFSDPVLDIIRHENADVVFLQELTPDLALAMKTEFVDLYPYQIMDARPAVWGSGILSRYPLHDTGETLPLRWVGDPQIIELDFEGTSVTLVNFHTFAYTYFPPAAVTANLRHREALAQELANFATRTPGPLIVAGDANAGDLSAPYRIITGSGLTDAWYEAGFGLGGTFPGSTVPTSSRWKIGSWYVPQWMVRIDYVFVSPHWDVSSAHVAQFDGVSDHRGVVVELVLGE